MTCETYVPVIPVAAGKKLHIEIIKSMHEETDK